MALVIGMGIDRALGTPALVLATAAVVAAGFRTCDLALRDRPGADPAEIVIDEVAGQWIALLFPCLSFWAQGWQGWLPWPAWVVPFLLFRLFDIWKPWVIGRADRRGDVAGVMLDDLWAGLFAGVGTILAGVAWHLPLVL